MQADLIVAGKSADGGIIEPIRGTRYYSLYAPPWNEKPLLKGGFGGVWETNQQRAACDGDYERCHQHLLQGKCKCGYYVRIDTSDFFSWSGIRAECIGWGAVDLWDKGARVEFIRLISLEAKIGILTERDVEALEKRYEIPVKITSRSEWR